MYGLEDASRPAERRALREARPAPRSRAIADYSYGMKKKVALCAALLHGPELVFLDEPFEGIDPVTAARSRRSCCVCSVGVTLVLTCHSSRWSRNCAPPSPSSTKASFRLRQPRRAARAARRRQPGGPLPAADGRRAPGGAVVAVSVVLRALVVARAQSTWNRLQREAGEASVVAGGLVAVIATAAMAPPVGRLPRGRALLRPRPGRRREPRHGPHRPSRR